MGSNNNYSKSISFFMVLLCVPLSGIGVDLYAPSLPHIATDLKAHAQLVQLTITIYMIGFGVAQAIFGPISDTLGRKRSILVGVIIYLISVCLMSLTSSIDVIVFMRLIQGISVALISVPARAINNDIFSGDEFISKTKTMVMVWGLGPILAPAIGGYLQDYIGWRANFWFMFGYGVLILFFGILFFKETNHNRAEFSMSRFLTVYKKLLSCKLFFSMIILAGVLFSFSILFHLKAPFIIERVFHKSGVEYGHIALCLGLGWFIGTLLAKKSDKFPIFKNVGWFLCVAVILSVLMILITELLPPSSWLMSLPVIGITVIIGISFSQITSKGLSLFPVCGGAANACYFAGCWFISGITSGILSKIYIKQPSQLSIAYTVISILTLLFFLFIVKPKLKRSKLKK